MIIFVSSQKTSLFTQWLLNKKIEEFLNKFKSEREIDTTHYKLTNKKIT